MALFVVQTMGGFERAAVIMMVGFAPLSTTLRGIA